jgi:iron(III) transport system substrate-binding protein
MKRISRNIAILCTIVFGAVGCSKQSDTSVPDAPNAVKAAGEVNVYTHRHYPADQALYRTFTEKTGVKVNVVKAKADELIKKLEIEGAASKADVLITVDAGRLVRARKKNLLQPITSSVLSTNVPKHLRDRNGHWFGLTVRSRVIVYAKDRVKSDELSTYTALADPKWKGRVLIRSSKNVYNQSLLAWIINRDGDSAAESWAAGIVGNMARTPKGNDRDQIKAVVAGVGDVAVVNTYYVGLLLNSDNPEERKVAEQVDIFFPNQADGGAHINVSGGGVTAAAPNRDNAVKLLEFLSSSEAQQVFATSNYEYPVLAGAVKSPLLESWGDFKASTMNLTDLGELNTEAVKIFDRVGWR